MDPLPSGYPYSGTLYSDKKKLASDIYNDMNECYLKCICKVKKIRHTGKKEWVNYQEGPWKIFKMMELG